VDRKANADLRVPSRAVPCFLSVVLSGFLAVPLCAQVAGARIAGTVTDSTGAAIVDAQVIIKNTASNFTRELVTNRSGFYSAPNLPPGPYSVTASAKNFKSEVVTALALTVGADVDVNFTMTVGAASQTVQVQGAATTVETNDATLGAVVNGQTIRELPLNGRDWTQLATLEPGVAQIRTQTVPTDFFIRGTRGLGTQMTVSGGRPQQNNYRVDGISINDYSNGGPGSALGIGLGVDAIQEFSVITANPQADYGNTSAGVINAVTRQGTNTLHGSVYEFMRNSALDARNYFDPPTIPPSVHIHAASIAPRPTARRQIARRVPVPPDRRLQNKHSEYSTNLRRRPREQPCRGTCALSFMLKVWRCDIEAPPGSSNSDYSLRSFHYSSDLCFCWITFDCWQEVNLQRDNQRAISARLLNSLIWKLVLAKSKGVAKLKNRTVGC